MILNNVFYILMLAMSALVGIVVSIVPYMTEKPVVFGVRVPASAVMINSGDFAAIIFRLKKYYTIATLIVMVLVVSILFTFASTNTLLATSPLIIITLDFAVYLFVHYRMVGIKRAQGWSVELNRTVSVDFVSDSGRLFPWIFAVPAFIVMVAIFAIGIAIYPSIPQTFPTHFGVNGQPNAFSTKSILGVFLVGFISVPVTLLMVAISFFTYRLPLRIDSSIPGNEKRASVFRERMSVMLLAIPAFINLTFLLISLETWQVLPYSPYNVIVFLVPIIGLLIMVTVVSLMTGQMGANVKLHDTGSAEIRPVGSTVQPKDDDALWRAGVMYFNRADPRILVPKRFGVGYTFNFGHPVSWLLLAVPIVIAASLLIIAS